MFLSYGFIGESLSVSLTLLFVIGGRLVVNHVLTVLKKFERD